MTDNCKFTHITHTVSNLEILKNFAEKIGSQQDVPPECEEVFKKDWREFLA